MSWPLELELYSNDHDLTAVSKLPQTPQTVTVEDRGYVDTEWMDRFA